MTDVAQASASKGGGLGPMIALGVGAVLLIALLVFSRSEQPLERSVTGMNGLTGWLRENDVQIISFKGGAPLDKARFGLRVVPIYDTDLQNRREAPEDREALIAQTSENDLSIRIARSKIKDMPTLVVLPKWRTGVRALGVAHKDLLIPRQEINRLLGQLGLEDARVTRDAQGFTRRRVELADGSAEVGLLHAQTINTSSCETWVSYRRQPLFLLCGEAPAANNTSGQKAEGEAKGSSSGAGSSEIKAQFWLLTDPDIASNHGLSLAENGKAILSMIRSTDFEKSAVLDLSLANWLWDSANQPPDHERTWDDVLRVFAWPFTVIWIAFGILAALVFWRAVTRYGPPARSDEEEPLAAKNISIDAKARLLRLANHDAALLKTHITARLHQLAAELLGPHRPAGQEPIKVLLPIVQRADPDMAEELSIAATTPGPGADLLAHLDRFEICYNRIRHEFGRTSDAG